jgi:hypothetical protein
LISINNQDALGNALEKHCLKGPSQAIVVDPFDTKAKFCCVLQFSVGNNTLAELYARPGKISKSQLAPARSQPVYLSR